MDIVGIGSLAYQIFLEHRKQKDDRKTAHDQFHQFTRSAILELRVAVNLIDLAIRCNGEGDAVGRNALLRKIRCPLLGALAMGMHAKSPTSDDPNELLKSLERPDDIDSPSGSVSTSESEDPTERVSLMVARLVTVQSLAESGRVSIGINWQARLTRLRREMISVLRAFLDTSKHQQNQGGK